MHKNSRVAQRAGQSSKGVQGASVLQTNPCVNHQGRRGQRPRKMMEGARFLDETPGQAAGQNLFGRHLKVKRKVEIECRACRHIPQQSERQRERQHVCTPHAAGGQRNNIGQDTTQDIKIHNAASASKPHRCGATQGRATTTCRRGRGRARPESRIPICNHAALRERKRNNECHTPRLVGMTIPIAANGPRKTTDDAFAYTYEPNTEATKPPRSKKRCIMRKTPKAPLQTNHENAKHP